MRSSNLYLTLLDIILTYRCMFANHIYPSTFKRRHGFSESIKVVITHQITSYGPLLLLS